MKQLIPKIVIGKRYLWRVQPTEIVCSECGYVYGPNEGDIGREMEITVLFAHSDTGRTMALICQDCRNEMYNGGDGWYKCMDKDGDRYVLPYNQLTEIAGVDYD